MFLPLTSHEQVFEVMQSSFRHHAIKPMTSRNRVMNITFSVEIINQFFANSRRQLITILLMNEYNIL